MPQIESWDKLPANVRQHLIDRMRDLATPHQERTAAHDPQPTPTIPLPPVVASD